MPTTCAVPEGAGWLGTAWRKGERLGREGWEARQDSQDHFGQIVIWITVQGLPFEQAVLGILIQP